MTSLLTSPDPAATRAALVRHLGARLAGRLAPDALAWHLSPLSVRALVGCLHLGTDDTLASVLAASAAARGDAGPPAVALAEHHLADIAAFGRDALLTRLALSLKGAALQPAGAA